MHLPMTVGVGSVQRQPTRQEQLARQIRATGCRRGLRGPPAEYFVPTVTGSVPEALVSGSAERQFSLPLP